MTKQDFIKKQYGQYFKNNPIDSDGWIKFSLNLSDKIGDWFVLNKDTLFDIKEDSVGIYFRLKTLHDIENNRGWYKFSDKKPVQETVSLITMLRTYHDNLNVFTTTTISSFDYHEEPELYKRYSHWKYKELDIAPLY